MWTDGRRVRKNIRSNQLVRETTSRQALLLLMTISLGQNRCAIVLLLNLGAIMGKKMRRASGAGFLVAAALLISTTSQATVIGSAYLNNAASTNAVIGFSHGAADVTFSVPSPTNPACTGIVAGDTLCFNDSNSGAHTLQDFLTSGGATVLTGSASALSSLLNNTVFEFTGTVSVTTGQLFQVGHDDGLQLLIGSILVINAPGPTGFTTTPATYNGPTGTFSFDLVYGECCGGPANLDVGLPFVTLPGAVPEPETLALLSVGLLGFGVARRKRS
jgi:hypothetical protein